jgi:N-acetylglucosamine kinase-like BadF-type ATPase
MSSLLFGGVEGGGSTTTVVILSAPPAGGRASVVGRAVGSGSNGWSIGVPAAAAVMHALLREARSSAGLPADAPLQSLGVCGSGFLQVRARLRRSVLAARRRLSLYARARAPVCFLVFSRASSPRWRRVSARPSRRLRGTTT